MPFFDLRVYCVVSLFEDSSIVGGLDFGMCFWATRVDASRRVGVQLTDSGSYRREEAVGHLRRLTNILLDNMEHGSEKRLMDPKELRLMGSAALRSVRLLIKTIQDDASNRDAAGHFPEGRTDPEQ